MAGNIYHKWVGSVLTITSDSGTSSCDLKGAKGDDGARGAQGAPGSSVAEDSQKLGGVAAAQYALKNNVPAHNLLDNSDFRNPVNQRGITSQIGGGYGLDRWRADGSGTISVESTGVSLTNLSFRQPVSLKAGTYTLAFKVSNGELLYYNFTYDGTSTITKTGGRNEITGAYINLYNQSNGVIVCQFVLGPEYTYTLVWAALYEGSYDASTLPAYQPKGYAAELAECQRYYLPLNCQLLGSGYTFPDGATFIVPRKMRIDEPSFVASGNITARVNGADYPLTLSYVTTYGSMIKVNFASNTIPVNYPCAFYADDIGVSLNADL